MKDIGASFGAFRVLDNVSISVRDHEIVVIVGPSGCGKTTLLKVIAGILEPTEGQVEHSKPIPGVAYMPQSNALFPWRTLRQNALLGLEIRGRRSREALSVDVVFTRLGLGSARNKYPRESSGGMRQRAAFARCVSMAASTVLLDEPFSSIDLPMKQQMQACLRETAAVDMVNVIVVTHDIVDAINYADRMLVMVGPPGRIIDEIELPDLRGSAEQVGSIVARIMAQINENASTS